MSLLYGIARPNLTTVVGGQERLLVLEPMSFQLQTNTEVVKSTKYSTDGTIVNAGVAKRKIESVLTMGVEAINWFTMQLALGEFASTSTNVEVPELRFGTVPLTGAQEISDPDITATATKTTVAVYTDNKQVSLTRVATAPAAGQYSVAAGKITVGPGYSGGIVGYRILQTIASCETIGVEAVASVFSKFSFSGILKTDDDASVTKIKIASLAQEQDPSLDIQSPTTFSLVYTLITEAGARRPYQLINVPVA